MFDEEWRVVEECGRSRGGRLSVMNREAQQGLFVGILLGVHLSSEMRILLSSGYGVGSVSGREGREELRTKKLLPFPQIPQLKLCKTPWCR